MKRNNKYWSNIAGFITGEMSRQQQELFLRDLEANGQLKKDFELMQRTWNEFDSNPAEKYTRTAEAWQSLKSRLDRDGMLEEEKPVIRMRNLRYAVRIAAVLILILAVGVPTIYFSLKELNDSGSMIEHTSESGTLTVDLPDGSRVFLNKGANLKYNNTYEEEREVVLEGEGYFDVMSSPEQPFRVNAGKVVISVMGTSFNVKGSGERNVEVYVESGKVKVSIVKSEETMVLEPGQLVMAGDHLVAADQTDANYLSWKTKEFKFVDEPVDDILQVLKNAYHVEVRTGNIDLKDLRLTTVYEDQTFDAILNTICTAHNINFKKEGKVYILYSN
ncbi:MAG: FecR domain-containing protein [Bacteroidales bacterium]|nr:FecR domain-containing protein [Bacteroidales bacterium]